MENKFFGNENSLKSAIALPAVAVACGSAGASALPRGCKPGEPVVRKPPVADDPGNAGAPRQGPACAVQSANRVAEKNFGRREPPRSPRWTFSPIGGDAVPLTRYIEDRAGGRGRATFRGAECFAAEVQKSWKDFIDRVRVLGDSPATSSTEQQLVPTNCFPQQTLPSKNTIPKI